MFRPPKKALRKWVSLNIKFNCGFSTTERSIYMKAELHQFIYNTKIIESRIS